MKEAPQLEGLHIQINFIDSSDPTRIAGSFANLQNLEASRIHSTCIARQDSKTLSNIQLDFRSKLQVLRPMTRFYFVILHLLILLFK
jgi:hypothetical protein